LIEKKEDVVMTKTKKEEPIFPHISFDEFNKSVVLVGKIIVVEDIPKSDKLYYLTVDFGQFGKKKIASGIKQHYQKDQLLEVNTIFSFNLAPRSLCGVVSEGMILMVKNKEGIPELIRISDNVLCGTRLG
jgi:methionyl-tRNA synthetase